MRDFASGRIGLTHLLRDAEITKNTFFRRYRYDPKIARLLDMQEDRDHRLHFRADAGMLLKQAHGKAPHGNRGRAPARACPDCSKPLHPRHRVCLQCGHEFAGEPTTTTGRSTTALNVGRREALRRLRSGD